MKVHPYPKITDISMAPKDGLVFKAPRFCHKANRNTCARHYADIRNKSGFHVCPYGFSSHVAHKGDMSLIYTGLKVEGYFNHAINRRIKSGEFIPLIQQKVVEENIFELMQLEAITPGSLPIQNDSQQRLEEIEEKINEKREFIEFVIHEIRNLNATVKRQAEEASFRISQEETAWEGVKYRVDNIFATSSLISTRLDVYDLTENPEILSVEARRPIRIYAKFEKVRHCLETIFNDKNLQVRFDGQSYHRLQAWSIFDILPFLILENAIKYTPKNQTISISFKEIDTGLIVQISSVGPVLRTEEESQVFEKKFRGANARTHSGSGLGLFLAKIICDLHSIEITAHSIPSSTRELGGEVVADFLVSIQFPRIVLVR